MCLAQGPQRSDAGEARTRGPSVSSQALYHWATALPPMLIRYNLISTSQCPSVKCGIDSQCLGIYKPVSIMSNLVSTANAYKVKYGIYKLGHISLLNYITNDTGHKPNDKGHKQCQLIAHVTSLLPYFISCGKNFQSINWSNLTLIKPLECQRSFWYWP